MRIGAAAARGAEQNRLLDAILPAAGTPLGEGRADLGFLFATNHFEDELEAMAARVRRDTGVRTLLGCTGEGVIGPDHEYEREAAAALWLAHLPRAEVAPFRISPAEIAAAESADDWKRLLAGTTSPQACYLMLGDPFTLDVNAFLGGLGQHFPGRPIVGGMASGGEAPGQTRLVFDDEVISEGVVGVGIVGDLEIKPVVSQGCRPIGKPYVITKSERNIIHQLGGRKPLEVLNETFAEADAQAQEQMRQGVLIGRVINEQQHAFKRGDFLIRNLIAADPDSGAIAIGDHARMGTTVQFHVRDAASAAEDLHSLLQPIGKPKPQGVLVFSCNGRGSRLFAGKDHDLKVIQKQLGPIAAAGFFCAGEIGPVGGKNFIHGHTASLAVFRSRNNTS